MKHITTNLAAAMLCAALLPAAGPAPAQESRWHPFITVTPVYEGKGDLDQGGDFSVWRGYLSAGAVRNLGGGNSAGVAFNYDYADYSFSSPAAFGGIAPWDIVQRYGVAIPLSFALRDGWSLGVIPSVDWFRENGADTGDSLVAGGIVSATRRHADGNRLGFGVGVYDGIEKTRVFPFLAVDWRLSDRWRIINPVAAGPTGPAGLELDYLFSSEWALGIGAAWRVTRFRLSDSGPVPGGIGEERGAPVFLRATHNFSRQTTLHLYAGVFAAGELRVEDQSGNLLRKEDFDPAPFLGVAFSGRF